METPQFWQVTLRREREGECEPGLWIYDHTRTIVDTGALDSFPLSRPNQALLETVPVLLAAAQKYLEEWHAVPGNLQRAEPESLKLVRKALEHHGAAYEG